jgi:hypothetical protein
MPSVSTNPSTSVVPSLSTDPFICNIILCPIVHPSLFPNFSNTTVSDVKSAVEHLLFALTNDTFIATLASNKTGVDIALSSIALSENLNCTQNEVQGALQTLVEAIDDFEEYRIDAFEALQSSLVGGNLLDFLVNVTDRIAIVKEDYVNFLDSRSNETKAIREHFTDKFRYVWDAILQMYLFCPTHLAARVISIFSNGLSIVCSPPQGLLQQ